MDLNSGVPVPSAFLSADELVELTGYRRVGDQRRWLTEHGWTFAVSAACRPIVARSYCEKRLGGGAPESSGWSPNLAVFRRPS